MSEPDGGSPGCAALISLLVSIAFMAFVISKVNTIDDRLARIEKLLAPKEAPK